MPSLPTFPRTPISGRISSVLSRSRVSDFRAFGSSDSHPRIGPRSNIQTFHYSLEKTVVQRSGQIQRRARKAGDVWTVALSGGVGKLFRLGQVLPLEGAAWRLGAGAWPAGD